ncbi:hypothetical protein Tco_1465664 [Tanacetum coccineum]
MACVKREGGGQHERGGGEYEGWGREGGSKVNREKYGLRKKEEGIRGRKKESGVDEGGEEEGVEIGVGKNDGLGWRLRYWGNDGYMVVKECVMGRVLLVAKKGWVVGWVGVGYCLG